MRFMVSDLSLLFNQQRLMSLGQGAIDYVVKMLRDYKPDPLKGLSDDQLSSLVKSRYIQSQSDVYNWTRYVQQNIDLEIQSILSANQLDTFVSPDPVSTDPS